MYVCMYVTDICRFQIKYNLHHITFSIQQHLKRITLYQFSRYSDINHIAITESFLKAIKCLNFHLAIYHAKFYSMRLQSDKNIYDLLHQNYFMLHGHETRLIQTSSDLPYVTLSLRLLGTPRRIR